MLIGFGSDQCWTVLDCDMPLYRAYEQTGSQIPIITERLLVRASERRQFGTFSLAGTIRVGRTLSVYG